MISVRGVARAVAKCLWGMAALVSVLMVSPQAWGVELFSASLKNGDYGTGTTKDTMAPNLGGSPHVLGIVNSADGVTFTSTDLNNRGNAVIYWQPGAAVNSFRQHGTISFRMKGDQSMFSSMTAWGHLWGENYGWNQWNNGQGSFSSAVSLVPNGTGPEDDLMRIYMSALNNDAWYFPGNTSNVTMDFGHWHSIGFTWGGPNYDYEIWIDGEMKSGYDLPAGVNLPWGMDAPQSGTNWGLGGLHERGNGAYSSAVGITYADLKVWDQWVEMGGTPEPATLSLLALGGIGILVRRRRK